MFLFHFMYTEPCSCCTVGLRRPSFMKNSLYKRFQAVTCFSRPSIDSRQLTVPCSIEHGECAYLHQNRARTAPHVFIPSCEPVSLFFFHFQTCGRCNKQSVLAGGWNLECCAAKCKQLFHEDLYCIGMVDWSTAVQLDKICTASQNLDYSHDYWRRGFAMKASKWWINTWNYIGSKSAKQLKHVSNKFCMIRFVQTFDW